MQSSGLFNIRGTGNLHELKSTCFGASLKLKIIGQLVPKSSVPCKKNICTATAAQIMFLKKPLVLLMRTNLKSKEIKQMITKPLEKEHCVNYFDLLKVMLQKGQTRK